MENGRTYKQVADLKFGDIVKMKAPYEENTKDYYFGHNVKDVMGGIMVDHFGRPYKIRPVMVIGFENNELTYCTLTSTAESNKDAEHQYKFEKHIDTFGSSSETYIELDGMRSIPAKEKWYFQEVGTLSSVDRNNITSLLTQRAHETDKYKDNRRFATPKYQRRIGNDLKQKGYDFDEETNTYTKDNKSVTMSKSGLIKYHTEKPIEQVRYQKNRFFEKMTKLTVKRDNQETNTFENVNSTKNNKNNESELTL